MADLIKLQSNLKYITSGQYPSAVAGTGQGIGVGEAAFGKWATEHGGDGRYHFYINSDGVVKDVVLDTMAPVMDGFDLQKILNNGNVAQTGTGNKVTIALKGAAAGYEVEDLAGGTAKLSGTSLIVKNGTNTTTVDDDEFSISRPAGVGKNDSITISIDDGIIDEVGGVGYTLLSGNLGRNFRPDEIENMRKILNVFSQDDIKGLMGSVFKFMGMVDSEADLPNINDPDPTKRPESGHVWQTKGTKELFCWIMDDTGVAGSWEILDFVWDMSDHYSKAETDALIEDVRKTLAGEIKDLQDRMDIAEANISDLDSRETTNAAKLEAHIKDATAGTDKMHSNNNYTDGDVFKVSKIITGGAGNLLLADNGQYVEVAIVVDEI